ncbi:MAG: long-chain fatty acid--CoA ligase [Gallionella sp.]
MQQQENNNVITPDDGVTLHGLFLERVKRTPDNIAYRYFDEAQDAWLSLTWAQTLQQMARWQGALQSEELMPGDRVALMLRNCPQWIMFEQAAMSLGLVVVPLYTVDRPDNVAYIINDADVKVLLFETEEQWQELSAVVDQLSCVKRMVSLDKFSADNEARLQCVDDWLPVEAELGWERVRDRDSLATIIYTSGTTGKPKGVMLSHHNIVYNAYAAYQMFPASPDDCALSFLPLSHTFERSAGYYLMMAGATIAFARSIPLLADDLVIIKPTILVAVPRIYERIYNAIHAKLEEAPPLRRKLFDLTVAIGWDRFKYMQGRGTCSLKMLLWPLLNALVAKKVMAKLGGRVRMSISGGAALPPNVSRLFISLGLQLVQGYGMTETSPVISANPIDNNYPASVGLPLKGIDVCLGDQEAILVRGPSNMLGYWHNHDATQAMIDKNGWLNTGDTGYISKSGHIYITGRLKEIIVMSNGEKVPPGDMEVAIMHDNLFDQVMVHGEGRPTLVALAVINPEKWQGLAKSLNVMPDMPETLNDSRVEQKVLERITEQIKEFPGYAKVKRVLLMTEPWTIENGLLTPTLKVKRPKVVAHFSAQIDELYEGH